MILQFFVIGRKNLITHARALTYISQKDGGKRILSNLFCFSFKVDIENGSKGLAKLNRIWLSN